MDGAACAMDPGIQRSMDPLIHWSIDLLLVALIIKASSATRKAYNHLFRNARWKLQKVNAKSHQQVQNSSKNPAKTEPKPPQNPFKTLPKPSLSDHGTPNTLQMRSKIDFVRDFFDF